jgi:sigma-E factor negative regulatory protein RseB
VTRQLFSSRRVASFAVVLGVVGACAAALALSSPSKVAATSGLSRPLKVRRPPVTGTAADRAGLRLMIEAANACQTVAYRGIQLTAWWGPNDSSTSVIQVWHRPGSGPLVQLSPTEAGSSDGPADAAAQDPAGALGVSARLLALMRANYQISYAGPGSAMDRPAAVVDVRRVGGGLAARFWIDTATKLPLRRELYDSHGRLISEDAFIELSVGVSQLGSTPPARGAPWSRQLDSVERRALRAQGWPLPKVLPDGLTLFSASETSIRSRPVVDLSYSDGLSVISLFVQHGQLPRNLSGWRQVALSGRDVYASDPDDRSLIWSSGGYVYTMIADAPAATVSDVVARLPHSDEPGFWERMARGFRRIARWADPFH